jgi:hypothetical protein
MVEWQRAEALARRREDGIADSLNLRQHAWLADSGRCLSRLEEIHLNPLNLQIGVGSSRCRSRRPSFWV